MKICKVLMLLSVILLSCKKEKDVDQLNGVWELKQNEGYVSRLKFGPGHDFSRILTNVDTPNQWFTEYGKFSIKGDSLFITISQELEKLKTEKVVMTPVKKTLFEKATFHVSGSKLTLSYISYPADAPVSTQMIFTQVDIID